MCVRCYVCVVRVNQHKTCAKTSVCHNLKCAKWWYLAWSPAGRRRRRSAAAPPLPRTPSPLLKQQLQRSLATRALKLSSVK